MCSFKIFDIKNNPTFNSIIAIVIGTKSIMKTKLTLSILLLIMLFVFEKGMAQAPSWAWAQGAGGTDEDYSCGITTDANGNVLVTGYFSSDSITFGATTLTNTSTGSWDIFIVKYDASGNVLWAKSVGGTSSENGHEIATDANGNVFVTGHFSSSSISFGTTVLTNNGSNDIFIVKYDASGNVLWAHSAGGTGSDIGNDISCDVSGNILVDIFIAKYDPSGNALWAKSAGGTLNDNAKAISTDAIGNVVVTGSFLSASLTFGTTTLSHSGSTSTTDIFIVKYDASGNILWAKSAEGGKSDEGSNITTDSIGNILVTGSFNSDSVIFGTAFLINSNIGFFDLFVLKYDASGNLLWSKSSGGNFNDKGQNISAASNGSMIVTGFFGSSSITFGTTVLTNVGGFDIFIVKYDDSGNINWVQSIAGTSSEICNGIFNDANGNVLVTGYFQSDSITFGTTILNNVGNLDIFIAKLNSSTGISEQIPNNNLTPYPNPSTDYITINTNSNKKQVITITDITGQLIYSTTTLSDKTIINTKDFPQGVYAVQVQAGNAVQIMKVVVAR